ncbi:uncharacterized protein LOC126979930 isoform X2 [Leptidea sinapis]|nr:uncharacterized protein LOC126979930 isoform X2 [Leptidea sinapis]
MLSDEMFSIKQNLYEKENNFVSTIKISTIAKRVPTPTLELKQMWPIEKIQSNNEKKANFEKHLENIEDAPVQNRYTVNSIFKMSNHSEVKSKVLEMRSLSNHKQHIQRNNNVSIVKKTCSCKNEQTRSTKSHCSHTTSALESSACSRSASSSYPFYITYQPYLVTVKDVNDYIYSGNIDNLNFPNDYKEEILYQPTYPNYDFNVNEKKENYDYTIEDHEQSNKKYRHKHKNKKQYPQYDADKEESDGNIIIIDKDKSVEDIVEDLKKHYGDLVIKDCFCSSFTVRLRFETLLMFSIVIAKLL